MPITPEDRARETIDRLLTGAGWLIQSRDETNVNAACGVAIREFPLKPGYGEADYLLYVDGVPAGVVEAKKEGATLSGYEIQTEKYSVGLPPAQARAQSVPVLIPLAKRDPRQDLRSDSGTI